MRTLPIILAAAGLCLLTSAATAHDALTATCKDGSSWSGAHKRSACRGHGGVQSYGATASIAPAAPSTVPPGQVATAPITPVAPPAPAPPPPSTARPAAVAVAPGGGVGQVWVNTKSKVYHCPSDPYYGKTKAGHYVTESAARAAGDHPDHGKACS